MKYRIVLTDLLDPSWSGVFGGLTVSEWNNRMTSLTGEFSDQAALHGCLKKIRDLGLTLISVNPVDMNEIENGGIQQ